MSTPTAGHPIPYPRSGMKKEQLARRLAIESNITPAAAADQLDRIIHDILQRVRSGRSVSLPGLGTFHPGQKNNFQFDASKLPKAERKTSRKGGR